MARTKKTARKQVGRRGLPRFTRDWLTSMQHLDDGAGSSQPRAIESEDPKMKGPMIEDSTDEEDPSEDSQWEDNKESDGEEASDAESEENDEEDGGNGQGHYYFDENPEEEDPNEEEVPVELEEIPAEMDEVPVENGEAPNEEVEEFDPILDEVPNEGNEQAEGEEEAVEEVINPVLVEDLPPPPQAINEEMLIQGMRLEAQVREQNSQLEELYHENHHQRNIIYQQNQRIEYYENAIGGTYGRCRRLVRETNHALYRKVEAAMDENGKIDGAVVLRLIMEAEEECIGRL